MNYVIISTGSKGNAILLENGILLDCGVSFKKLFPYLRKIKAVFISHIHSDHFKISTIKKIHFFRPDIKFLVGFFLEKEILSIGVKKSSIYVLNANKTYKFNHFTVLPFNLIHDVKNFGLKIFDAKTKEKIFYAVDTRTLSHVSAPCYDLYLVEANYSEDELKDRIENKKLNGQYIYEYRVSETHLSLQNASEWLMNNRGNNGKYEFIHEHV